MEPSRDDDAVVDLLDVLLRDGAMLQADVIVTVADVPLIGINLRAAIAGMATMRDHGFFEEWDAATRAQAVGEQRAATRRGKFVPREESGTHGPEGTDPPSKRPGAPQMSERRRSPPSDRPDRSKRPGKTDSRDDDETPGRPHDSERPGDPDRSSVSERPRGSERPRELNVDVGERSDENADIDDGCEEGAANAADDGDELGGDDPGADDETEDASASDE